MVCARASRLWSHRQDAGATQMCRAGRNVLHRVRLAFLVDVEELGGAGQV